METTKRIYAPHELIPATPIHPGEMIKDELQARGISQKKFAEIIGVSHTVLNEVLNGKPRRQQVFRLIFGSICNLPIICRPPAVILAFWRCWNRYAKRLRCYSYDEQNLSHSKNTLNFEGVLMLKTIRVFLKYWIKTAYILIISQVTISPE